LKRYPFVTERVITFDKVPIHLKITLELLIDNQNTKMECDLPMIDFYPSLQEEDSKIVQYFFTLSVFFHCLGTKEKEKLQCSASQIMDPFKLTDS